MAVRLADNRAPPEHLSPWMPALAPTPARRLAMRVLRTPEQATLEAMPGATRRWTVARPRGVRELCRQREAAFGPEGVAAAVLDTSMAHSLASIVP